MLDLRRFSRWICEELVLPAECTRNKWSDLLRSFQIQYYGIGVSVARQYYHTRHRSDPVSRHWITCIGSKTILPYATQIRKTILPYATQIRSGESPLDYLYRLHVAGLRARLKIKDGSAKERREHVDHYIETFDDQDLAGRRSSRSGSRKEFSKKAAFGSSKYRQKPTNTAPSAPAKLVRTIQIQANDSGSSSESDGLGGSDSDIDSHRRIFLASNEDVTWKGKSQQNPEPRLPDRDHGHQDHNSKIHADGFNWDRCSHCESRKHRIFVAGSVLHARSVAREDIPRIADFSCVVDMENCMTWENVRWKSSIKEIRQWLLPTKHMGMLPEAAEKMLN
ncbi:LOW QUALITY PROTEIN: hypothetical protein PHMEG_0009663 [Phytophthora megakarya]|uniref:Uncharacterized protein n=1 Tax=Phytophthora megakarya TaxID=4795 RepID=A0A225WG83_9STRA|nr:LOW QUALITY PROTEIN: hypothetical protein PHMEG_0009663 [Phytophthora megakarya]